MEQAEASPNSRCPLALVVAVMVVTTPGGELEGAGEGERVGVLEDGDLSTLLLQSLVLLPSLSLSPSLLLLPLLLPLPPAL